MSPPRAPATSAALVNGLDQRPRGGVGTSLPGVGQRDDDEVQRGHDDEPLTGEPVGGERRPAIFYALVNEEIYLLLVADCGWDLERFRRWTTEVLREQFVGTSSRASQPNAAQRGRQ